MLSGCDGTAKGGKEARFSNETSGWHLTLVCTNVPYICRAAKRSDFWFVPIFGVYKMYECAVCIMHG